LKLQSNMTDNFIASLKTNFESQVKIRDNMIAELQSALETQVNEYNNILKKTLLDIYTSRYWKLLSRYWHMRDVFKIIYLNSRSLQRKLLPFGVRRFIVNVLSKINIRTSIRDNDNFQFQKNIPAKALKTGTPSILSSLSDTYDIICLPIIEWDFRYQRPQQLVSQFAADGHRCFYVSQTYQQTNETNLYTDLGENIVGVHLPGLVDLSIYSDEISPSINTKLIKAINELRIEAGIIEAVCFVQLPFWVPIALEMKKRWGWKIVYDCMDDHAGFSTNSQMMLNYEKDLVKKSDLVLASSKALFEKCKRDSHNVLLLPNAADFDHFNKSRDIDPLPEIKGPIIGYYGAISEWFDSALIIQAAQTHPDWQFVLIGDTFGAQLSLLPSLTNVHLLGEIPYQDLPKYLKRFDVACIPFKITNLTLSTNPVKFYEYLSAGKPVVSSALPELIPFTDYVSLANSPNEFESQIKLALTEQSEEKIQSRVKFAKDNSWKDRYSNLKGVIHCLYGKVAIILISYNNLGYLTMCLQSIWKNTIYQNFKVIVVDNGSSGGVIDYLEKESLVNCNLRVIYNQENFGYSKAINIGISEARECDFLVLLNDDTIVTRGWLNRLIHYLHDPEVELVGPVTNWAGNEARIHVNYNDLDEMELFSQQLSLDHEGKSFDIPMLAMYCLAMRKSLIDRIGLLDERFGKGMFEDDDFCLRVRRIGGRIICVEDVFIHHWGRASLSRMNSTEYNRLFDENLRLFEEKWGIKWQPHKSI